jgi:predicted SnoaL-like aldol condensation-catalyzing enzyme
LNISLLAAYNRSANLYTSFKKSTFSDRRKTMKKFLALMLLGLFSTTVAAQVAVEAIPAAQQAAWLESSDPQIEADKRLVYDFWRKVLVARNMDAALEYMDEDYIQHNPGIPTGRAAFVTAFGRMGEREEMDYIDGLVSITAENGYVTLAMKRELENPNMAGEMYTTTWFDMFRIEDGKVAEHWDYGTIRAR